ncbi:MAG: DUF6285 domain-containing protein [Desertimonas sp.]
MAQFLPESADLLAAIAKLLDEQVLAVVPSDLQHRVRVAANLSRILEREARLGPDAVRRERELIEGVLDEALSAERDPAAALAERLRGGVDDALAARAWSALVDITRADLAIAKPGHDVYEGV